MKSRKRKTIHLLRTIQKKQVTLIGYLLGIKEFHITNPPFDQAYLQKIKGTKEIEIIRALSILRLNFIYAYDKIYREKQTKGPFAQFDKMEQMIDAEALHYLQKQGLDPLQYGVKLSEFTKHIANINQLIEENIDNIHKYIPEWVEWNYIKELFIMPGCASGPKGSYYNSKQKAEQINAKIHEIRKDFYNNQNFYPYKTYFNWNEKRRPDDYGNILFNDGKFLKLLYSSHYDTFTGLEYVIDAKSEIKNDVYDFITKAVNVAIFVDCENVDPYEYDEDAGGAFVINEITPIQMPGFNLQEIIDARKQFTKEEWIDLIIRSTGMECSCFDDRIKWHMLARIAPMIESNMNICELGPRSTGKSHIYKELSPNSILLSGGQTTVANLFYNMSKKTVGLVGMWDVVAFDEVAGIKFKDNDGVQIMKDYMNSGSFVRGKESVIAKASMVFEGNINQSVESLLKTSTLFEPFPEKMIDTAFLDRMHMYIPGWEIPKLRPEFFTDNWGFVSDYFAEFLREMRKRSEADCYHKYFKLGRCLNQRDKVIKN